MEAIQATVPHIRQGQASQSIHLQQVLQLIAVHTRTQQALLVEILERYQGFWGIMTKLRVEAIHRI